MIEIIKSKNHEQCGSCMGTKNLFDLRISGRNSTITNVTALCGDCLRKLKEVLEER